MTDILDRLEAETHRSGMWADTCLLLDEAAAELRKVTRERDEAHQRNITSLENARNRNFELLSRALDAERERDELRAKLATYEPQANTITAWAVMDKDGAYTAGFVFDKERKALMIADDAAELIPSRAPYRVARVEIKEIAAAIRAEQANG